MARSICSWKLLQQQRPDGLDDWSLRHLDKLVALDETASHAGAGETLLHFDIRADNLLLTPERVWFVDWPHACVGAAWVDLVGFAPSVTMQGGPTPELLLRRHPGYRDTDPDAITSVVAAIAGYFTHRALQPAPPGLPTVRAFQAAQGVVARRWLAERTGWS
jgi:Ser/Thr protein kinase RdoA (MazF antagonist)